MNKRRELLVALGAGALTLPLSSLAQQPGKTWHVGFFYYASRQAALESGRYNAFVQGMRELGYFVGTNLLIEERYGDGNADRLPGLAAELVRLKVDVIVATGGQTYRALQQRTNIIPVVTTVGPDPVGDGYAASLSKPGRNYTGLTTTATDLGPKLVEIMIATVPKLSRVAVLLHPDNAAHPQQLVTLMAAAQKVGVQVMVAQARSLQDIDQEFSTMARNHVGAAMIINDAYFVEQLQHIAAQALKNRLPSIVAIKEYAAAGGLMSYGADLVDNFRRAATYVDKILKGAKAGDLPFELPSRYYLEINMKTAKALGIKFPQSLLISANKVIE